ncbi:MULTISPECIES: DUF1292 domain-containing protein [Exiguobacterium]|uniref:UPF0473 protein Exig_2070 n=2 Tax=Exiguobacterium TaxID=33986 RepID=Y2070_EXIS2|nr:MULTISPECIES: DUF1292 domain-containing protein [Exiguobacterium]B1YJE1.1 RecName: Full=UPF0473 protein Exig_2070 [Exiguobacterium sibiricum 255-15]ACB61522.1 protein of unknown function DUF1292 [Exiguobacterium sibiricum 255-15]MCT4793497.1 DUF1292 domain-containing protein [Exiguobacterium artemiae]
MQQNEPTHYVIPDGEGNEFKFAERLRYESPRSSKTYIFLEPVGADYDEAEEVDIFVYELEEYGEGDDDFNLVPIAEDDAETWDEIEEVFNTLEDELD